MGFRGLIVLGSISNERKPPGFRNTPALGMLITSLVVALAAVVPITRAGELSDREINSGLAVYSVQVAQANLVDLAPTTATLASYDNLDRNASAELLTRLKRAGATHSGRPLILGDDVIIGGLALPLDDPSADLPTQSASVLNFLVEADPYKRSVAPASVDAPQFGWALQGGTNYSKVEQQFHFIQTVEQIPILGSEASVTINRESNEATDIDLSFISEDELEQIPELLLALEDPEKEQESFHVAQRNHGEMPDSLDAAAASGWQVKRFILRTSDGLRPIFVFNPASEDAEAQQRATIVDAETLESYTPQGASSFSNPSREEDSTCENMPLRDISVYEMAEHELITGFEQLLCAPQVAGQPRECVFGRQQEYPGAANPKKVRVVVKDGFRDDDGQLCGNYISPTGMSVEKTRIYLSALETLFAYATYLYEELDWCGLDGECQTIQALIFDADEYPSAKFDHTTNALFFGENPVSGLRHTALNPSVIGHELVHGMIRAPGTRVHQTACTKYQVGEQFGALEESLGDVVGTLLHAAVFADIDPESLDNHGGVSRWGFNEFGSVHYRDLRRPFKEPARAPVLPQANRFLKGEYSQLARDALWDRWESDGGPQPEHFDDRLPLTCDAGSLVPYINSGIPNKVGYLLMTARQSEVEALRAGAEAVASSDREWHADLLRVYHMAATKAFRCRSADSCFDFCLFRIGYEYMAFEVLASNAATAAVKEAFDLVGIPSGSCN